MWKVIFISIILLIRSFITSQVLDGFTLLTNIGGAEGIDYKSKLIDNDFVEINVWNHNDRPLGIAYLSTDSVLTIAYKPLVNEGVFARVIRMNWTGEIIGDAEINIEDFEPHHDIEVLPNGNILLVGWETKTIEEATQAGKINATDIIKPDMVIEIQMVGLNDFEIVWEWHSWDHLIQDQDSEKDNFGIIADNPRLADVNLIGIGPGSGDWLHINSISYNEELDQIILSIRHLCEFWVIDHSTTIEESAGHSGGQSGFGGDIIYRWGNPQNYDRGDESDQLLYAQHGVVWIPASYPGEGNILLFNNRHNNINNSAVLEIIPEIDENGNYFIEDGQPFGPNNVYWYIQSDFYSLNQSGAFRLSNGNTFITISAEDKIIEVDNIGNTLWEYEYAGGGFIPRALKYWINYFIPDLLGDLDGNSIIDIVDIIITINIILDNIEPAEYQLWSADLNADGIINISDIVIMVNLILDFTAPVNNADKEKAVK